MLLALSRGHLFIFTKGSSLGQRSKIYCICGVHAMYVWVNYVCGRRWCFWKEGQVISSKNQNPSGNAMSHINIHYIDVCYRYNTMELMEFNLFYLKHPWWTTDCEHCRVLQIQFYYLFFEHHIFIWTFSLTKYIQALSAINEITLTSTVLWEQHESQKQTS